MTENSYQIEFFSLVGRCIVLSNWPAILQRNGCHNCCHCSQGDSELLHPMFRSEVSVLKLNYFTTNGLGGVWFTLHVELYNSNERNNAHLKEQRGVTICVQVSIAELVKQSSNFQTTYASTRCGYVTHCYACNSVWDSIIPITVRLLTHVLSKPTHFFFHSFIATISYSLQTSFSSVMKDRADKYPVWGTPTRSSSRSNSR